MKEIDIIISIWREINFREVLAQDPMMARGRVGRFDATESVCCVFVFKTEHWVCFEGLGSCNLMVSVKNDNTGDYTIVKVCVGSINNHLS